jgi:hypothetical protein
VGKYRITVASIVILLVMVVGCSGGEETKDTQTAYIYPPTPNPQELEKELINKLIADEMTDITKYPDTIENKILTKYLDYPDFNGYFTIVNPEASLWGIDYDKELWKEQIKIFLYDYDDIVNSLVDELFDLNANPIPLSIKSSITEGYYINYDGKFGQYQKEVSQGVYEKGSGWGTFLYKNFPHFQSDLIISLPAYDPETGYVLLYVFSTGWKGPEDGDGWPFIVLMKYEDGNLTKVFSHNLFSVQMRRMSTEPDFGE